MPALQPWFVRRAKPAFLLAAGLGLGLAPTEAAAADPHGDATERGHELEPAARVHERDHEHHRHGRVARNEKHGARDRGEAKGDAGKPSHKGSAKADAKLETKTDAKTKPAKNAKASKDAKRAKNAKAAKTASNADPKATKGIKLSKTGDKGDKNDKAAPAKGASTTARVAKSLGGAGARGAVAATGDASRRRKAKGAEPCFGPMVIIDRGGLEGEAFPLVDCHGKPLAEARDRLSVLARPWGHGRPAGGVGKRPAGPEGEIAPGVKLVDAGLLARLDKITRKFPKGKLSIVSGYRPQSAGSLHHEGRAIDLRVSGVSNADLVAFCKTLQDTGCGFYPNSSFVHVDVRPAGAGGVNWIDASGPGEAPRYVTEWPERAAKEAPAPSKHDDDASDDADPERHGKRAPKVDKADKGKSTGKLEAAPAPTKPKPLKAINVDEDEDEDDEVATDDAKPGKANTASRAKAIGEDEEGGDEDADEDAQEASGSDDDYRAEAKPAAKDAKVGKAAKADIYLEIENSKSSTKSTKRRLKTRAALRSSKGAARERD